MTKTPITRIALGETCKGCPWIVHGVIGKIHSWGCRFYHTSLGFHKEIPTRLRHYKFTNNDKHRYYLNKFTSKIIATLTDELPRNSTTKRGTRMTKVKYEKIGTVDVTVADIAFIGQMFAVTNYLEKHPEIMAGNIDLIGELAHMVIAGGECETFVKTLQEIEQSNKDSLGAFRLEHHERAGHVFANIMLASVLSGDNSSSLDAMLQNMINYMNSSDHKKSEVRPNAPETIYQ